MPDGGVSREPLDAPIGRVRLVDPDTLPSPDDTRGEPAGNGWSASGVGFALLILLVMIGALAIILWGAFQTRL